MEVDMNMATTQHQTRISQNNQSTDKVLAIIELLAYNEEPMRLIDIANQLKFNTSTTLRFLNSLEQNGYIYKNRETLRYQMTYKICGLANQVNTNTSVIEIASNPVKQLSMLLGECVCLAVEQDYTIVYVYVADGPGRMLRTTQRIGTQAPMHCTGVGKVILSEFPESKIDDIIQLKGLTKYTEHTLTTKEALMEELQVIRRRGYAYDNQECELGARCIAFPLRDYTNKIIACLSVTGPLGRMTDEFINSHFRTILETAQDISHQLGYHTGFAPF